MCLNDWKRSWERVGFGCTYLLGAICVVWSLIWNHICLYRRETLRTTHHLSNLDPRRLHFMDVIVSMARVKFAFIQGSDGCGDHGVRRCDRVPILLIKVYIYLLKIEWIAILATIESGVPPLPVLSTPRQPSCLNLGSNLKPWLLTIQRSQLTMIIVLGKLIASVLSLLRMLRSWTQKRSAAMMRTMLRDREASVTTFKSHAASRCP